MADPDQIRAWKRTYENIYSLHVRGIDYVFRALTFTEFDGLRASGSDAVDLEDEVVAIAILDPPEGPPSNAVAGVVTVLAKEILETSGFGSIARRKELLETHRAAAETDLRTMMKAFVLSTMPVYREEELDAMTFESLARKVVLAEHVLKVQQASVGIDNALRVEIVDPEDEEEAMEEAKRKHAASKPPGTASFDDPIAARLHSALG